MIDENKGYVTKSKITTTVKILGELNDRSRVAATHTKKHTTQRDRNWQTFGQKNKRAC